MKKLRGVLFIILINIVSIILLEYVYSQRWRLQKSADVSEYEELIVGEWGYREYFYTTPYLNLNNIPSLATSAHREKLIFKKIIS